MIRYACLIIFIVVFTRSHPVGKSQKVFDLYQATCDAVFISENIDCIDVTYRKTHRGCKLYCTCDGSYEEYFSNENFESCGKSKVCFEGECQKIVYSGRYDSLTDGEVSDSIAITGKKNPCKIIYFNNATKTELFQDSYPNGKECYDSESGENGKCNSGVCTPLKYFGSQESESIETIYSIEDDVDFESEELFSSSEEFEDEYLVYISNEERIENNQKAAFSEEQNLNTLEEHPQEISFRETIDEKFATINPGVTLSYVQYIKKDDEGKKVSDENNQEDVENRGDKKKYDRDFIEKIDNEGKGNSDSLLKEHRKGGNEKPSEIKHEIERNSEGKCICGPATSTEPNEQIKVKNVGTKGKSKEAEKGLKENQNKQLGKSGKVTTKNPSSRDEANDKNGKGANVQDKEIKNVTKSKEGSKQKTSHKPGAIDKSITQSYTEKPSKFKNTKEVEEKLKNNSKDKDLESNKSAGKNENVTYPTSATLKKDETSRNPANNPEKYTVTPNPTVITSTSINKVFEITTKGTTDSTNKVTGANKVKEMVSKKDKSGEKASKKESNGKGNESTTTIVYSLDKSKKKSIIPTKIPNTKDKKREERSRVTDAPKKGPATKASEKSVTDKNAVKESVEKPINESVLTYKIKGKDSQAFKVDKDGTTHNPIGKDAVTDAAGSKQSPSDKEAKKDSVPGKKGNANKMTELKGTKKDSVKYKSGMKDGVPDKVTRKDTASDTFLKKGSGDKVTGENGENSKDATGKAADKNAVINKAVKKDDVSDKLTGKDTVPDTPLKKGKGDKVTGEKGANSGDATHKAVKKDGVSDKLTRKDTAPDTPLNKGPGDKITEEKGANSKDATGKAADKNAVIDKVVKRDGVSDKLKGKDTVPDIPLSKGKGDEVTEENGANSKDATGKAADKDVVIDKAAKTDGVSDKLTGKNSVPDIPLKEGSDDKIITGNGAGNNEAAGKTDDAKTDKADSKDLENITGQKYVSDSHSVHSSALSNGEKNDSKGNFARSINSRDDYLEASEVTSFKVVEDKISSKV